MDHNIKTNGTIVRSLFIMKAREFTNVKCTIPCSNKYFPIYKDICRYVPYESKLKPYIKRARKLQ